MMKQLIPGLLLLASPHLGLCEENVFDVHVHVWNGEKSIQDYLSQLKDGKQEVAGFGGIHMAPAAEIERTRQKNDELIALAKRYPKLMPIASVHPYDGEDAMEELKRLASLGVKAIKLHPHTQRFEVTDPRVLELCRLAGKLGLVILMDNANIVPGDSENLFNLAVACPDTDFIFAHMGGLNFRFWNILPLARTAKDFYMENIHFDISAVITLLADSPVEDEFVWTIRNVGIDNVLLGSDYPQISLPDAIDALKRLDLTESEKNKIRYDNARRIFFSDVSRAKH
jgi:predicted TIM-barrel fold metal-dependent hydrolase